MTEPTAALISNVIVQNKSLRYLDLSSNRLGPVIIEISVTEIFIFKHKIYFLKLNKNRTVVNKYKKQCKKTITLSK